jgi:Ca-activated chloride channel homolog
VESVGTRRIWTALAAQGLALLLLVAALLGATWLDARGGPRFLILVDRSQSVPREAADQAVAKIEQAARSVGGVELQWLEFAGRPGTAGETALDPAATNIEAALEATMAAHARTPFDAAIVISDGQATVGNTARALRALHDAGLALQWIAVGSPPPATRIASVLAPERATVGQRIQLGVQLEGRRDLALRVKVNARSVAGETQQVSAEAGSVGPVSIEFDAGHGGAVRVDVTLEDAASGQVLDAASDAAVIDVVPRASILYARGSAGPLMRSLLGGGWSLDVIPAERLETRADRLGGYGAVILDDVAIADAGARFWTALVAAVQQRGIGLLVLGGERSFGRGGYRGSVLESVLPLLSEPPALDQPASVVFAVDKSGSMGRGSGGVDRFQLAQRAVLEAALGLGERDSLGLLVFDVEPRVLIPLGPARAATAMLERAWPATPMGGTRLAPALDAAIGELERSGTGRRLLVMVTDGMIDEAPLTGLRARLERARIETLWLAVGPEADLGALERVIGPQSGWVLRAAEAAELPLTMRSALERRRARVERGPIAVLQRQPLPFAPGTLGDWPVVAAHLVTRPRPQAVVAVQSERGDPLIAFQSVGPGRVMALPSGLGHWTPRWLAWQEWPRLTGGMADWIVGAPAGGAAALSVQEGPDGPQVLAELSDHNGAVSMVVTTPTGKMQALPIEAVAAGRWRAPLTDAGPGLYTIVLSTPFGLQRQLYLRRQQAESEVRGLHPALAEWQAAGLIGAWDPGWLARRDGAGAAARPIDRSLLVLALALFLCGLGLDRLRPGNGPATFRSGRPATGEGS